MFTITPDNDDIHVRAIVRGEAELQELVDKLIAFKEKTYGRHDSVPPAVPTDSISGLPSSTDIIGLVGRNGEA